MKRTLFILFVLVAVAGVCRLASDDSTPTFQTIEPSNDTSELAQAQIDLLHAQAEQARLEGIRARDNTDYKSGRMEGLLVSITFILLFLILGGWFFIYAMWIRVGELRRSQIRITKPRTKEKTEIIQGEVIEEPKRYKRIGGKFVEIEDTQITKRGR